MVVLEIKWGPQYILSASRRWRVNQRVTKSREVTIHLIRFLTTISKPAFCFLFCCFLIATLHSSLISASENSMGTWESGRLRRRCCCCLGPPSGDGEASSRTLALLLLLVLVSSVPLAIIASLERSAAGFTFQTPDWICECAKWDPVGRSFLASTFLGGGVARLTLEDPDAVGGALTQRAVLSDPDVVGNVSLGMAIDRGSGRRRILVVYADLLRCRSSSVAAYDLESWSRIFLTHLSGPGFSL